MMTTGSVRGKCSTLQDGHSRFQPACDIAGRLAAIGAEAMARMPGEQRLRLGERREMLGSDQSLHGDRAQVGDEQIGALLQRLGGLGIERDAEAAGLAGQSEKHRLGGRRERARFLGAEQRVGAVRGLAHHHEFAADRERAARPVGRAGGKERLVAAALGDARQNAGGIAEQRLRPEIEGA